MSHNFFWYGGPRVSKIAGSIVRDGMGWDGGKGEGVWVWVDPADSSASRSLGSISFGADDGGGAMVEIERGGVPR